ncbi:MAG: hypothetical protein MI921_03140 [Cytophagales bacterium]|nr:hypothetical protein [Cytophagales bacterium]
MKITFLKTKLKSSLFVFGFLGVLACGNANKNSARKNTEKERELSAKVNDRAENKEKLVSLLGAFGQGRDNILRHFHQDALIEFPYAKSIGTPEKLNYLEYHTYLTDILGHFDAISFSNTRIYPMNHTETFVMETHGEVDLPNGKTYRQDYVMIVEFLDGKIYRYKEYWNPLEIKVFETSSTNDLKESLKKQ